MPGKTREKIFRKHIELNTAHPFTEGNGRSTGIRLDPILRKNLSLCTDRQKTGKKDHLQAMEKAPLMILI